MALLAIVAVRDGVDRLPSYVALSQDRSTRAQAEGLLDAAAPGSVAWSHWHRVTPMWALQDVEGVRRDVGVEYVYPRGAQPYAETFADRVAESVPFTPTYATSYFGLQFATRGLCTVPLNRLSAWEAFTCPLTGDPTGAPILFDGRIEVFPLKPGLDVAEVGTALDVIVTWRAAGAIGSDESLTVRMMRPDGRLASNADIRLDPSMAVGEVRSQRVTLGVPMDLPPGRYPLLVGAYRSDGSGFEALPDQNGADYAPAGQVDIQPASAAPVTRRPMNTRLGDTSVPEMPTLAGVDYDTGIPGQVRLLTHWRLAAMTTTVQVQSAEGQPLSPEHALPASSGAGHQYFTLIFDVPPWKAMQLSLRTQDSGLSTLPLPDFVEGERYVPFADQMVLIGSQASRDGGLLRMDLNWLSARPIVTDYIVSARVNGDGIFLTHDSVPVLGAIPTLKWIRGSQVVDRHVVPVGERGELRGTVVVYDSATQQALPPLDERYEQGVTVVTKWTEGVKVSK